jgi:hypothetical protein
MQVKSINWLSVSAAEAEVEITDGVFTCTAFACPCGVKINDEICEPLHIFEIRNAMLSRESETGIWNINKLGLGRRVVAELTNSSSNLLRVGDIKLFVDGHLPGGIQNGDIVEFECARIDLW